MIDIPDLATLTPLANFDWEISNIESDPQVTEECDCRTAASQVRTTRHKDAIVL